MVKKTSVPELFVPVSEAFENRLAELVWEGMSELARQTICNRMSLSVEVDSEYVERIVVEDVVKIVSEGLQREVLEAVRDKWDPMLQGIETTLVADVLKSATSTVQKILEVRSKGLLDKVIEEELKGQIMGACKEYFGSSVSENAKVVRARVDEYVSEYFESHVLSHRAVHREMAEGVLKIADADSRLKAGDME